MSGDKRFPQGSSTLIGEPLVPRTVALGARMTFDAEARALRAVFLQLPGQQSDILPGCVIEQFARVLHEQDRDGHIWCFYGGAVRALDDARTFAVGSFLFRRLASRCGSGFAYALGSWDAWRAFHFLGECGINRLGVELLRFLSRQHGSHAEGECKREDEFHGWIVVQRSLDVATNN